MGAKVGFEALTGSGSEMSSMLGSLSISVRDACSFKPDGPCCLVAPFPACFLILMSEAGVAGSSDIPDAEAEIEACCFASRDGDLPAVLDLGVAGGGIKISDRDSGEMDSASELS